jgi:hypothetical protein
MVKQLVQRKTFRSRGKRTLLSQHMHWRVISSSSFLRPPMGLSSEGPPEGPASSTGTKCSSRGRLLKTGALFFFPKILGKGWLTARVCGCCLGLDDWVGREDSGGCCGGDAGGCLLAFPDEPEVKDVNRGGHRDILSLMLMLQVAPGPGR